MKILKTIPYSEFYMWDVKRFVKSNISSKYNIVELSNYITERSEKTKLFNFPDKEFGILGVNNKVGLFDAYKEFGKNINQSYKRVENQDLAYNPYRVNVGSIGWKTEKQKNDFISPAYVVFETQKDLSSEFLYRMFKTDIFNQIIRDNTTGSVRQNLKFDTLSKIKIPLPPLAEQNRIVSNYNSKIKLANDQEQKAKQLEQEIEEYLFDVLGIEKLEEKENVKGLQFVQFKEIEIWSIWNINTAYKSRIFPNISLGKILSFKSGEFLPKKFQIKGEYKVYGGNGLNGYHNEFIHQGKRIIIGRVGEYCGNVHLVDGKYWVTDNAFLTDKLNDKFEIYFLSIVLSFIDLNRYKVLSAQPSISQQNLINVPVPLPPLKIQTQITNHISDLKQQIKDLQKQAKENRVKAIQEFEEEIFS
ncbi:restriction endonuclease subunit S [Lutibacter sp.]|uniref:restriction endonuclease subunit S n=1 Tax=Lutibacter sp. TaxID=1925666 RepID=UPI0025C43A40|nr:restriction endonuclease subunit S [Lutibacter sp.]MCF6180856.1 restriction endonuclease subunit S [Lutibacter sp.]